MTLIHNSLHVEICIIKLNEKYQNIRIAETTVKSKKINYA